MGVNADKAARRKEFAAAQRAAQEEAWTELHASRRATTQ